MLSDDKQDLRLRLQLRLEDGDGQEIAAIDLDRVYEQLFDPMLPYLLEGQVGSRFYGEVILPLKAGLRRWVRDQIAPVHVVRGNTDYDEASAAWPGTEVVSLGDGSGEVHAYMLHDIGLLDLDPAAAGFSVVC